MAFTPQDLADRAEFERAYWDRNPTVRAARQNAADTKARLDKLLAPKPAPVVLVVAPNDFSTVYVAKGGLQVAA